MKNLLMISLSLLLVCSAVVICYMLAEGSFSNSECEFIAAAAVVTGLLQMFLWGIGVVVIIGMKNVDNKVGTLKYIEQDLGGNLREVQAPKSQQFGINQRLKEAQAVEARRFGIDASPESQQDMLLKKILLAVQRIDAKIPPAGK